MQHNVFFSLPLDSGKALWVLVVPTEAVKRNTLCGVLKLIGLTNLIKNSNAINACAAHG